MDGSSFPASWYESWVSAYRRFRFLSGFFSVLAARIVPRGEVSPGSAGKSTLHSRRSQLHARCALYIDGYPMPAKELVNGSSIRPALPSDHIGALHYFNVVFDTHEVICAEGTLVESFGGGKGIEDFTNFAEYKRLYPDEPCPAKTAVAPNLGRARAHLYALLGLAASPLVKVRDPLQKGI